MSNYIGNRVGFAVTNAQNDGGIFNIITLFNSIKRQEWFLTTANVSGGLIIPSAPNGYRYHVFTSSGVLQIGAGTTADILIIAGGGGGTSNFYGGGGGAGGAVIGRSIQINEGSSIIVTIGQGGPGGNPGAGTSGSPSSFGGVTAIGGGAGGGFPSPTPGLYGGPGGSGGGGSYYATAGGTAVPQPVPPGYVAYGNPGGATQSAAQEGNGGGAGSPGTKIAPGVVVGYGRTFYGFEGPIISPVLPGPVQPLITDPLGVGPTGTWAGGGGGGYSGPELPQSPGGGGRMGGSSTPATPGVQYTGGGGGGNGYAYPAPGVGGDGGSGIVIVRFIP